MSHDDLKRIRDKLDDIDAGVAFRDAHGVDRETWIANEVAAGTSPGRARDRCRKMANEALVGHRLREQEREVAKGRGYAQASRRPD